MWALEYWELTDTAITGHIRPIIDLDGNRRVEHGRDGMIVRTRGDCDHMLHASPDRVAVSPLPGRVLLYCSTCERAIEAHVSELPPCVAARVEHLLPGQVDWARSAN